jgi:acyl-CoA thioester hydrolase
MMFSATYRVYYEDTDASGVMYHARYLVFFERARTDLLRHLGFQQDQLMREASVAFTLSDIHVQYRKPARLDDELSISVAVDKLGSASLVFSQTMTRVRDGLHLASAKVRAGCVQFPDFRACRMPSPLRHALQQHQVTHVI